MGCGASSLDLALRPHPAALEPAFLEQILAQI
ncbi:hypothetical protein GGR40_002544 [Novosphingobium gossypii]